MVWTITDPRHAAAQDRLEGLADDYLGRPDVAWGRMFGTTGLAVRGKIFAVAVHAGALMVKIPAVRAAERLAAGEVTRMVMRGREMREWVVADLDAPDELWRALLDEAYAFLDEITPR